MVRKRVRAGKGGGTGRKWEISNGPLRTPWGETREGGSKDQKSYGVEENTWAVWWSTKRSRSSSTPVKYGEE